MSSSQNFLHIPYYCWYYLTSFSLLGMFYFSSFKIGGFVASAAIAGVYLLIGFGLGDFFSLGIKGLTDY